MSKEGVRVEKERLEMEAVRASRERESREECE